MIDIETTGSDPAKDRICEIASIDLAKVSDKYISTNGRSTLVNPGIPMLAEASAVHHIVDGDLRDAPCIQAVIFPFTEHYDSKLVMVAHNASFERSFLTPLFDECECQPKWVCTYRVALRVWPDLPSHSNQFLRYHLGFVNPLGMARDQIVAHRALGDCYVTGAIFLALVQRASFADMLAWSDEPPLKSVITFGKHKGIRYDAAPRDYLEWIVNKSDMDADTKYCARHWLNQKVAA
ncbi:MAG: hypothetical protein HOO99_03985 [Hyphomicrobiaceae bacterium]|nr:hypothetical protein [Hyphomicrobiaceae bacterium]